MPVGSVDDLSRTSFPANMNDHLVDTIISSAKQITEMKQVRKAFNSENYEVPKDKSSRAITVTVTKSGLPQCKRNECIHFQMHSVCEHTIAVAIYTNTLKNHMEKVWKSCATASLLETSRFGVSSGAGTKKGYKKKRVSKRKNSSSQKTNCVSKVSTDVMSTKNQGNDFIPLSPPLSPKSTITQMPLQKTSTATPIVVSKVSLPQEPTSQTASPSEEPAKKKTKSAGKKIFICDKSEKQLTRMLNRINIPLQQKIPLGRSIGPKPVQPEPQCQPYEIIVRGGQISVCNGCGTEYDKSNASLLILGRNELDWFVNVNKKEQLKNYKTCRRNFYYCAKRRCLLARRPMLDLKDTELICFSEVYEKHRVMVDSIATVFENNIISY